ncbi:glucokinase [Pelagibius sp.]|uniref:glucokinase n=1 Tax=Pelagibius sp. TaxID=1931238 RepID=UPI00261617C2|nr:glucokinase [Pelagibius sp.]
MTGTEHQSAAVLADIGGTNARFALLRAEGTSEVLNLNVCDHKTAYDALAAALDRFGVQATPQHAVLAFAGPVSPERALMTNTAWETSASDLRQRFGFHHVKLMNDYAALALGLIQLTAKDRRSIGPELGGTEGPLAVVGPGSGLGVAALLPADPHPIPLVGEGGHATMAAADDHESELIAVIRGRLGHISAERLLSGPGLSNIHQALAALEDSRAETITPAEISSRGVDGSDPLCHRTLEMFCNLLGSFAGSIALCYGARGGVYLGGGILPRFPEILAASQFRDRFESKGRLQSYLSTIPTWLITRPNAAFAGLAAAARQLG